MARTALLIANEQFPADPVTFPALSGPVKDSEAIEDLLRDPKRGFFDEVIVLRDQDRQAVEQEICRILEGARRGDLVFLYYAGHGKLDSDGSFFLAMSKSNAGMLRPTSLPAAELRQYIEKSRSGQVILVLDCCYSGAAGIEFRGDPADQLQGRGIYLVASCRRTELAAENQELGRGAFTRYLTEGIKTSKAAREGSGEITIEDVYEYVASQMAQEGLGQHPVFHSFDREGDPPIISHAKLKGSDTEPVDASRRWPLAQDTRRPIFELLGPTYMLDATFHFVDWNPAFDEIVARPLKLNRGDHAEDFVLKLVNVDDVVKRSNEVFTEDSDPLVDIELLVCQLPKFGQVRFQKIASQIADERGDTQAWVVNLNVLGAENAEALWECLHQTLVNQTNWSRYAVSYDTLLLNFPEYHELTTRAVEMLAGTRRVADFGAGTGNGALALLDDPEREVWAIEFNQTMLDYLRYKIEKLEEQKPKAERLTILKGDLVSCLGDVDSGYFDGGLMINTLYALDDPVAALREISRVLRPGGTLVLTTSTDETDVDYLFDAIERALQEKGIFQTLRPNFEDAYRRHQEMMNKIHRDTEDDLRGYLDATGFEIEEWHPKQYARAVVLVKARRAATSRLRLQ